MRRARDLALVCLLLALLFAGIATIIGFRWLGVTDTTDWPGWLSLSFVFVVLSLLLGL